MQIPGIATSFVGSQASVFAALMSLLLNKLEMLIAKQKPNRRSRSFECRNCNITSHNYVPAGETISNPQNLVNGTNVFTAFLIPDQLLCVPFFVILQIKWRFFIVPIRRMILTSSHIFL
jgi:hypothetical protein